MPRGAAGRAVVRALDQRQARRGIVAYGRDLGLSGGERCAWVLVHAPSATHERREMKSLLHIRILVVVAAAIVGSSIATYVTVPGAGQASPGPGDVFVNQSQSTISFSSPGRTILRLEVPPGPNYLVWVTASFVNTDKDGKPDKVTCFLNGDAASAEFDVGLVGGRRDAAEVVAINGAISNQPF